MVKPELYAEYHKLAGTDPVADAEEMELAIIAAIESEYEPDAIWEPISFEGAAPPNIPGATGKIVSVSVQFTTLLYRRYGGIENQ